MHTPIIMNKPKQRRTESARSQATSSIKEVLERYLEIYRLKDSFDETYVTAHWEKIMGKPIASRTKAVFVKQNTLYVQIDSAPLREELVRARSKILELVNNEIGKKLVHDIVYF
jgi:predicted nucleic acid-binding Zn ribbon protein